ncbi:hypothetical protein J6590_049174 [Homalodisca vitripennis]|nr:hypothetical protein J6590_049174 [Homalodisca vitripennis]
MMRASSTYRTAEIIGKRGMLLIYLRTTTDRPKNRSLWHATGRKEKMDVPNRDQEAASSQEGTKQLKQLTRQGTAGQLVHETFVLNSVKSLTYIQANCSAGDGCGNLIMSDGWKMVIRSPSIDSFQPQVNVVTMGMVFNARIRRKLLFHCVHKGFSFILGEINQILSTNMGDVPASHTAGYAPDARRNGNHLQRRGYPGSPSIVLQNVPVEFVEPDWR